MPRLSLRHAFALGLLQGPTELLPVSSTAHTILLPFLLGWPYAELDPQLRKSFEVCLHGGAAAGLALSMRAELIEAGLRTDRRRVALMVASTLPPALAGLVLERPIERRLSDPRPIAAGLALGAVAMALADVRAARREARDGRARRGFADAGPRDGFALGLAQAVALLPGVSRSGATLTVARARSFARADAELLSWHAALPVILGASSLKGMRLARGAALPPGARALLATGAASAFASMIACASALRPGRGRPLVPFALYRCALSAATLRRLRGAHNTG